MCNPVLPAFGAGFMAEPTPILIFGDSLTAGYGLDTTAAFPARLENRLREKGYDVRVIASGVTGDTTSSGLTRLTWVLDQQPVDVVVLELGSNDMLRGIDPAVMSDHLQKMLDIFKQHNIPVLLTGMKAFSSLGDDYAARYTSAFETLAKKNDVLFYPFFLEGVALDPALNQEDGLHPNATGVDAVVNNILPMVETLLTQNPKQK